MLNSVVALFNAGAAAAAGDYESIATVTVGSGGVAEVEFTSIAADWTHLQIRGIARSTNANTLDNVYAQYNGDNGNNYKSHWLSGNGSSTSAGVAGANDIVFAGRITGGNSTASMFGALVIDILDYANTNKNKTSRVLTGHDQNGSGESFFFSGVWFNTNAITSIKLYCSGVNLAQYSHFALYGIKGA